jgi:preprotein translocase subunit SecG
MQTLLIVVQLIVSVALVGVVLLQRSEGGALGGMGGGGSGLGGLFSPRGAADTLTRTTAILAAVFFLSSLGLTLLALHGRPEPTSILDQQTSPARIQPLVLPKHAPQPAKPAAPQGPAVPNPHPQ